MQQLVADPLKLKPDRQFSAVEIEVVPCQPESLAAPQSEHEDQDERGVQRILGRLRMLQEPSRLVTSPGLPALLASRGSLTRAAGLRAISSRSIALDRAERSARPDV